jgi:hypothetical protein
LELRPKIKVELELRNCRWNWEVKLGQEVRLKGSKETKVKVQLEFKSWN